jgi:hypothetical protein
MLALLLLWGLILGPEPTSPPVSQPGADNGLMLHSGPVPTPPPAPPHGSPPPGIIVPIDVPTTPPSAPLTPRPTSGPLLVQARCGCLKWDYAPDPNLAFFRILVSETSGQYAGTDVKAQSPGQPTPDREVSCRQLYLFRSRRYYAVVQAVGMDGEPSDHSNEICLEVKDGVLFSCADIGEERCDESDGSAPGL